MKLRFGIALLGLLGIGALSGCGGSSGNSLPDPTYRFLNFCPDATLELLVDDTVTFSVVGFLSTTTNFQTVKSELKDFSIEQTGSSILIDSQANTLAGNTDTIIYAFGLNNYGTENQKRLQIGFQQINRVAPNGTKAHVYGLNAFNRDPGNQDYNVIFKNPGTNSSINFASVGPGVFTDQVIDAGTVTLVAQRENTETVVATVTKTFEAGKIYIMALTGTESGTGVTAPAINFIEIAPK